MNFETKPDDPAHPMVTDERDDLGLSLPGLTKREYFAARALQGLLSKGGRETDLTSLAVDAVDFADMLMRALNGGEGEGSTIEYAEPKIELKPEPEVKETKPKVKSKTKTGPKRKVKNGSKPTA